MFKHKFVKEFVVVENGLSTHDPPKTRFKCDRLILITSANISSHEFKIRISSYQNVDFLAVTIKGIS